MLNKKVLFTATIDGHIRIFHTPYLKWFKEQGYEVHVAARGDAKVEGCDYKHDIPFERKQLSWSNVLALRKMKELIRMNNYAVVHCHTPIAGVLTRLAARTARRRGTKVIYTAHGFHFYKGGPLKYWLLYFPVEIFLSRFTDCVITINAEDYSIAKRFFGKSKSQFVNGVGVNLLKFRPISNSVRSSLRKELGFDDKAFILVYPAEISARKNHEMLIRVAEIVKERGLNVLFLFAGRGSWDKYERVIRARGLEAIVQFLGFRYDIEKFIHICDVGISASRQEGLPINVVEAMACGKPVVVTNVRGNCDLVQDGVNGYLINLNDAQGMADRIAELYSSPDKVKCFGLKGNQLAQGYSISSALSKMTNIYEENLRTLCIEGC